MPGIRPDSHPYATILLVVVSLVGCLIWRTSLLNLSDIAVVGKPGSHWWRLFTAPFVYDNTGYAFVTLTAIGLFGWLNERRHGPIVVLLLFLLGGVGGTAAAAAASDLPVFLGANGAALALLVAWAVPDLLTLRRAQEVEGDLIGAGVLAAVVALMPLALPEASWISDGVGVLAGLLIGYPLAKLRPQ